jgi:hypothetical protein
MVNHSWEEIQSWQTHPIAEYSKEEDEFRGSKRKSRARCNKNKKSKRKYKSSVYSR